MFIEPAARNFIFAMIGYTKFYAVERMKWFWYDTFDDPKWVYNRHQGYYKVEDVKEIFCFVATRENIKIKNSYIKIRRRC